MILANLLRQAYPSLAFSLVEVGARPVGQHERFHDLLDLFPASRLLSFEPDTDPCAQLQREAGTRAVRYIDRALGRRHETANTWFEHERRHGRRLAKTNLQTQIPGAAAGSPAG